MDDSLWRLRLFPSRGPGRFPLPLLAYTGNYLSVDPADGSYWVSGGKQVTHFSPTGEQWWQGGNFGNLGGPGKSWRLHAEPAGRILLRGRPIVLWVAEPDPLSDRAHGCAGQRALAAAGFYAPFSLAVNPRDGSCWVCDAGWDADHPASVGLLDAQGNELWRGSNFLYPEELAVNQADGSCWVADTGATDSNHNYVSGGAVVHLGVLRYANFAWGSPLAQADPRSFKRGATIQVKFALTDLASQPANGAVTTLHVYAYQRGAKGREISLLSSNQFRCDGNGTYLLTLTTRSAGWTVGVFLAQVTLDDGQQFSQTFTLK